jgi:hypothetical protein
MLIEESTDAESKFSRSALSDLAGALGAIDEDEASSDLGRLLSNGLSGSGPVTNGSSFEVDKARNDEEVLL